MIPKEVTGTTDNTDIACIPDRVGYDNSQGSNRDGLIAGFSTGSVDGPFNYWGAAINQLRDGISFGGGYHNDS